MLRANFQKYLFGCQLSIYGCDLQVIEYSNIENMQTTKYYTIIAIKLNT